MGSRYFKKFVSGIFLFVLVCFFAISGSAKASFLDNAKNTFFDTVGVVNINAHVIANSAVSSVFSNVSSVYKKILKAEVIDSSDYTSLGVYCFFNPKTALCLGTLNEVPKKSVEKPKVAPSPVAATVIYSSPSPVTIERIIERQSAVPQGLTQEQVIALIRQYAPSTSDVTYVQGVGSIQGSKNYDNEIAALQAAVQNAGGATTSSQWTTAGSNIYYNAGNVGIGTSTPGSILTVAGSSLFTGSVTANTFIGDGSQLTGLSSFSTSTARNAFSAIAPLTYSTSTGVFSISTSTLGLTTSNIAEGSNLYYTDDRVGAYITASTTLASSFNSWTTSGADIYRVGGNVGIGTDNPTTLLQLQKPGDSTRSISFTMDDPKISFTNGNEQTGDIENTYGSFQFGRDGMAYFGIKQDGTVGSIYNSPMGAGYPVYRNILDDGSGGASFAGNVGIGTIYPNYTLSLANTGATIGIVDRGEYDVTGGSLTITAGASAGGSSAGGDLMLKGGNSNTGEPDAAGDVKIYGGINNFAAPIYGGAIRLYTSDTERLTILNDGSVGIGSTTPTVPLSVTGNGFFSGNVTATSFIGNGSQLTGITSFSTSTTRNVFSSSATGLSYATSTGIFSLTSGYTIPLSASTTEWANKTSSQWTTAGSNIYYNVGNVGIGTTTPGSALSVAGNGVFTGDVNIGTSNVTPVYLGKASNLTNYSGLWFTSSTPVSNNYTFLSDGNNAYINTASGLVQFRRGNVSNLTLGSVGIAINKANDIAPTNAFEVQRTPSGITDLVVTTTGNVGVGTTTPGSKLDVWGNLNVGTGTTPALNVNTATGIVGIANTLSFPYADADKILFLGATNRAKIAQTTGFNLSSYSGATDTVSSGIFTWNTVNSSAVFTEKMRLDNLGNLGIGSTSPSAKLTVSTGINSTSDAFSVNGLVNTVAIDSNGTIRHRIGGTSRYFISTNGFNDFALADGITQNDAGALLLSPGYTSGGSNGVFLSGGGGGSNSRFSVFVNSTNTPAMVVRSSGNVGIGTTSPFVKLDVYGNLNVSTGTLPAFFADASLSSVAVGTTSAARASFTVTKTALNSSNPALLFNGQATDASIDGTNGVGFYLTRNATANRQFVIADSATGVGVRYINAGIDGYNSGSRADLKVGTESNGFFTGFQVANSFISFSNRNGGVASKNVLSIEGDSVLQGGSVQTGALLEAHLAGTAAGSSLILNASSSLGLGTTTPGATFTVRGTSTTPLLEIASSSGASIFRINANGSVGIGTTTNTNKFSVFNSDASIANLATFDQINSLGTPLIMRMRNARGSGFSPSQSANGDALSSLESWGYDGSQYGLGTAILSIVTATSTPGSFQVPADLTFLTNSGSGGSEKLRITGSGNIGIGSTTPAAKLGILGTAGATTPLFLVASSTNASLFQINSNGNVGIGTSTPFSLLTVGSPVNNLAVTGSPSDATFIMSTGTQRALTILGNRNIAGGQKIFDVQDGYGNSTFSVDNFGVNMGQVSSINGSQVIVFSAGNKVVGLLSDTLVNWSAGSSGNYFSVGADIGLARQAANILKVTNGTASTWGSIIAGKASLGTTTVSNATLFVQGTSSAAIDLLSVASSTGTTLFTINQSGNVGIGSSSPYAKLTVQGSSDQPQLVVKGNSAQTSNLIEAQNSAGTVVARIDNSGIVNLAGTGYLRFSGGGAQYAQNYMQYGSAFSFAPGSVASTFNFQVGYGQTQTGTIGTMNLGNPSSIASGTLDVMTINPSFASQTGSAGWTAFKINPTDGAGSGAKYLADFQLGGSSKFVITGTGNVGIGTTTPTYPLTAQSAGTDVARFVGSGGSAQCTVVAGTGWSCTSDERMKQNIVTLNDSLNKVLALRGVTYKWKSGDTTTPQIGFIAQEVEKIIPELVRTDADGNKSMLYAQMTPYLVESIKALNLRLDSIESLVASTTLTQNISGGNWVGDLVTSIVGKFTKVETDTIEVRTGIEMKDEVTAEIYCLKISAGEWKKTKGVCSNVNTDIGNTNPPPLTPVPPIVLIESTSTDPVVSTSTSATSTPVIDTPAAIVTPATSTPIVEPVATSTSAVVEVVPTPETIPVIQNTTSTSTTP